MGNRIIINQLGYKILGGFIASCKVYHVKNKKEKIERIIKISNDKWAENHIKNENYVLDELKHIKNISKKIRFYDYSELNSILSNFQRRFINKKRNRKEIEKRFNFCVLIKEFIPEGTSHNLNNKNQKILENIVKKIHEHNFARLDLGQWPGYENWKINSEGEIYMIEMGSLVKKDDVPNSKFIEYVQKDLKDLEGIFEIYGI